ncbi:MAG: hypothetical protein ACI88H_000666 [Cocleimonas sp.]|jgi:hypothetical protein
MDSCYTNNYTVTIDLGIKMKKAELLKTDHTVQLRWLSNQLANINHDSQSFLSKTEVIERAYEKLSSTLVVNDADLEHFISVHLSKIGQQRLVTTLRVNKKRMGLGVERLQVDLSSLNNGRLNQIVALSGKTKIEIINYLISNADLSDFEPKE